MNLVAIDTEAFLGAKVGSTFHFPDGSAHNADAMWWRRNIPQPGTTWTLSPVRAEVFSGPAVVDDFGNLVLAGAPR